MMTAHASSITIAIETASTGEREKHLHVLPMATKLFYIFSGNDRDFRGGNKGANIERRDDRRDNNRKDAPRREGGNEIRREEREIREPRREKSLKDLEERMPKMNPQTGPVRNCIESFGLAIQTNDLYSLQNLNISNAFAGLEAEVDAD